MRRILLLIFITFLMILAACGSREVVVYTSVDQNFSEKLFDRFERDTGIKVKALYDTEAGKTTGLVQRLIAEKDNPRADVFWNGEIVQTLILKEKDVLDKYMSAGAEHFPKNFRDEEGYWTAFGGRARVFIVNTELLDKEDYPKNISDYFSNKYDKKKIGIARPLSGTTFTQAGALYALWGNEKAKDFYSDIDTNETRVVEGNSVVRDMVAEGSLIWGLTDTDDALGALKKGAPVDIVFPDQGEDDIGTLIIPNSAAIIAGGPNRKTAEEFMDYILSVETEKYLIEIDWCQVGVRETGAVSPIEISSLKSMDIDFESIFKAMESARSDLQELFVK